MRRTTLLFLISTMCAPACGSRSALLDSVIDSGGSGGQGATATGGTTSGTLTTITTSSTTTTLSSGGTGSTGGGTGGGGNSGGSGGGTVGTPDLILSISPDSAYETTSDLQVTPDGTIVVVWAAHGGPVGDKIGYAFSKDGGLTFTPPALIIPSVPGGANRPKLAVTPAGDVFVTWQVMSSDFDYSTKTIFSSHAVPGETVFGEAAIVFDHDNDALDHPNFGITPNGTLIECYHRPFNGWTVLRSSDGVIWEANDIAVEATEIVPCALAEGATGAGFAMAYRKDDVVGILVTQDEGLTWSVAEELPAVVTELRCAQSADQLVVAGAHDAVSVLVRTGLPGDPTTWLLDKVTFQFKYQFFHVGATLLDGGDLAVSFYTHSMDLYPAEGYRVLRQVTSGEKPPQLVFAQQPLNTTANVFGSAALGLGTGLAARGKTMFTSYVDNSSGASHVAFHRGELP